MTLQMTSHQAKFEAYTIPAGAKITPRVAEYVETRVAGPLTNADQIARLAAKYRAIRNSMTKQVRSGDPVDRVVELEANAVSIREAANLRK